MNNKPDVLTSISGLQRVIPVYITLAAIAVTPIIYVIVAVLVAIQHGGSLEAFKGYASDPDAPLFEKLRTGAWALGGAAAALSAYLAISMRPFLKKMVVSLRSGEETIRQTIYPKVLIFVAIGETAAALGLVGFLLVGDLTLLIGLSAAALVANFLWIPAPSWLFEKRKEEE